MNSTVWPRSATISFVTSLSAMNKQKTSNSKHIGVDYMLNRVVLVGRLTKDPDLKVSQNNISVATFTLAVNRPFTSSNGERGADFINCVVFRKQAENVNQYLKKGS